jgi:hypothetical protein
VEGGGVHAIGDEGAAVAVFVAAIVVGVGADQGFAVEVLELSAARLDHPVAVLGDENVGGATGLAFAGAEGPVGVGVVAGDGEVVVAGRIGAAEGGGEGEVFPGVVVAGIGDLGEMLEVLSGEAGDAAVRVGFVRALGAGADKGDLVAVVAREPSGDLLEGDFGAAVDAVEAGEGEEDSQAAGGHVLSGLIRIERASETLR